MIRTITYKNLLKVIKTCGYLLPLVASAVFLAFYLKPDLKIFPGTHISSYSDVTNDHGNSVLHSLNTTGHYFNYSYTLQKGAPYPYLGISIFPDSVFYNLSEYDYLEIEIEAQHSKRIPVHILVAVPGLSNPSDPLSFRQMELVFPYTKNKKYQLNLRDFSTPAWWFTHWQRTEADIGKPDYARSQSLSLQSCQMIRPGIREHITVFSVTCKKNNLDVLLFTFLVVTGVYGILFLWYTFHLKHERRIHYQKLEWGNQTDEDTEKMIRFIAVHYTNPELGVEVLQKELGFSEGKIYGLFKNKLQTSVKKYVNAIRLAEAKRLLTETDRQVSEIAFKVGYSNVSHFNRLFKETTGKSPNEYRKNLTNSAPQREKYLRTDLE